MRCHPRPGPFALVAALGAILAGGPGSSAVAQVAAPPVHRASETADVGEGRRIAGQLVAGPTPGRFQFAPEGAGEPIPLERVAEIVIDGPGPEPTAGPAPFRVHLGAWGRLSGRMLGMDAESIRLDAGASQPPLVIRRPGVSALVQRPGELQVLSEGFEAIDPSRWSQGGEPDLVASPRLVGEHALRMPAGGASLTSRLAQPIHSGRFELAYFEDGRRVAGQRWFVDLTFRKANGELATIRTVGGWSEETPAVETPGGPPLVVQRLERKAGWHRLSIWFDDERASLSVDGDDLAHGRGLDGPLVEVRIATEVQGATQPPGDLAAFVDDLRLVRFAEPSGRFEVEPTRDEVRLVSGDQLFGDVDSASADGVSFRLDGRRLKPRWDEVAGLYLRRSASPSAPIAGTWVRVEWRTAPGDDARDVDRVEAALAGVSPESIRLDVPYVGSVLVPRGRVRKITTLSRCARVVIDAHAHHLGDRVTPDLDPPQPEVAPVEYGFALPPLPAGAASLALDVVQVIGEEGTDLYSALVKKGQLRTRVSVNGRRLDDLNTRVTSQNVNPLRVRLAIPDGVLKEGFNVVRFEQTETEGEPRQRDNLGILTMALEIAPPAAGADSRTP